MLKNSMRMMVILALVGVCGCSKKAENTAAEKIIEAQSGGKVKADLSDGKMTVKTEQGTFAVDASGSVAIPDTFPKDVSVPKSTKIMSSASTPQGVVLTMESASSVADIMKTFSTEMKAKGWTEEATYNQGVQAMASYKKDNRTTAFVANTVDGKTTISLTAELAK